VCKISKSLIRKLYGYHKKEEEKQEKGIESATNRSRSEKMTTKQVKRFTQRT